MKRTWNRATRGLRGRIKLALRNPLRIVVFVLALAPLWGFGKLGQRILHVINHRIQTFHELEMYEGDMALHAIRVLNHQELYPNVNGDYIPLLYTPLYSYLFAEAMKWIDPPGQPHTIYAGRMVSIWATAGILLILFLWVVRETGSVVAGLGAAGMFYAANPLVGWWFDIARVDMTHTFFVAAGVWAFLDRKSSSQRAEIFKGMLAGLFFTCGFFTKQTAGQIALGMTLLAFGISPLRAFWGMVTGATLGGLAWLYFVLGNTDFFYLCVTVPTKHMIDLTNWQLRLQEQFYGPAAAGLATIIAWTYMAVVRRRWRHIIIAFGLVWTAYFCLRGALTIGGYYNHYLPIWFYLSLCAGIAVGTLFAPGKTIKRSWLSWGLIFGAAILIAAVVRKKYGAGPGPILESPAIAGMAIKLHLWTLGIVLALAIIALAAWNIPVPTTRRTWRGRVSFAPVILLTLLAFHMAHYTQVRKLYKDDKWMAYDTQYRIPKELEGANRQMQAIRDLDGAVWIPHANYYAYLVGRPTDISTDHVRDVGVAGVPLPRYVIDMIGQKKYKYILLNNANIDHDWQMPEVHQALKENYTLLENWDSKFGWQALKPVDMTAQKPRALLIRKDMIPALQFANPPAQ